MRILIVHDFAGRYGGGEHMAFGLRDSLRQLGHSCRLFASSAELVPNVQSEADRVAFGTTSPLLRVTQAINPAAANQLRRELREFPPDVVHVRMFLSQLSPLILPVLKEAKRHRDLRCVLHVVNPEIICPISLKVLPNGERCTRSPGLACYQEGCLPMVGVARTLVQHGLMRRWLNVFDTILANSESMAEQLRDDGIRCDGYVYNGVPEVARRPPLQDPPTALFAGRLVESKGAHVLIEAWPTVRRNVPAARLVIAGDGPQTTQLRKLVDRVDVANSISFTGHLTHLQMRPYSDESWLQAIPSLWLEPFGISCAEAMMRGTAVIASGSGGLAEQVVAGETGLLPKAGDVKGWSDAIITLLSDRGLCEEYGNAGRVRALQQFTQRQFIDSWVQVYANLRKRPQT